MARFELNKPVTSDRPNITVDAGLPPGQYRFRLEVEDQSGNRSRSDEVVVTVFRPVIGPVGPLGPVIVTPINR